MSSHRVTSLDEQATEQHWFGHYALNDISLTWKEKAHQTHSFEFLPHTHTVQHIFGQIENKSSREQTTNKREMWTAAVDSTPPAIEGSGAVMHDQDSPVVHTSTLSNTAPPIPDDQHPPKNLEYVRIQNLLPGPHSPGDSTGEILIIRRTEEHQFWDNFNYEVCSFTNVCVDVDGLSLSFSTREAHEYWTDIFLNCFTPRQKKVGHGNFGPCHCFYKEFYPRLLPWMDDNSQTQHSEGTQPVQTNTAQPFIPTTTTPTSSTQTTTPYPAGHPLLSMKKGHWGSVHKYVRPHHIAHWAQKLVFFQSALQYYHIFPKSDLLMRTTSSPIFPETHTLQEYYPPWNELQGMVFHDMDLPLSDHEQAILNITLHGVLHKQQHPMLAKYLNNTLSPKEKNVVFLDDIEATGRQNQRLCYERLSWIRAFGIFSTLSEDTKVYRQRAYDLYLNNFPALQKGLQQRCPPRRIVMIYRENRGIINKLEVASVVKEMTGYDVDFETISGESTAERQISLFASAGILLSPHSSQMINIMFSHPNSVMIEVTAEFYNADFGEYAHGMGVYFQYALGGDVPDGVQDPGIQACIQTLNKCEGDSHCILIQRFFCGKRSFANKPLNFNANITAVRVAIKNSLAHLNWVCGGKW